MINLKIITKIFKAPLDCSNTHTPLEQTAKTGKFQNSTNSYYSGITY